MALSGLDIYKLLKKTNCRECGYPTCLAFAMALAKKQVSIDKCPHISDEVRLVLEASSLPPIKLVSLGEGENKLDIGNETVMFRHEEKFYNPCGIGFIIDDNLADLQIKQKLENINKLKFERVGQKIEVNLVAVKQNKDTKRFLEVVKLVSANTSLALVLMSESVESLKAALEVVANKRPLIYSATNNNLAEFGKLAVQFNVPLTVTGTDLESVANMTVELNKMGVKDLILDTGKKPIPDKIWDLTQIRRLSLKKSNRSLGYPTLAVVSENDPYEEAIEAATYVSKYCSIILIKSVEAWQTLSILTLRQNIYTDPQKPLQIEPKIYPIGQANEKSPVLVTTNFSLSYYTVLGEVEASKIPSYIISVDTEGMSVLTAWAAEKFTPDKIADTINKLGVKEMVSHTKLIIPGYVAVMSGDLEEKSGWQIIVGPKEAAGIPSFLKNL